MIEIISDFAIYILTLLISVLGYFTRHIFISTKTDIRRLSDKLEIYSKDLHNHKIDIARAYPAKDDLSSLRIELREIINVINGRFTSIEEYLRSSYKRRDDY